MTKLTKSLLCGVLLVAGCSSSSKKEADASPSETADASHATADSVPGIDGTVATVDAKPAATTDAGALSGATVEVVGASPANATTTAGDGTYSLTVVAGSTIYVRASATDYLPMQTPIVVDPAGGELDLSPPSNATVMGALSQLGLTLDTAKGVVILGFETTTGSITATLGAAHDPSFNCGSGDSCTSESTTPAGTDDQQLIFPNTVAGTTTVVPSAGCAAEVPGITNWRVDADTITQIDFACP
jgi:hypothetical protein